MLLAQQCELLQERGLAYAARTKNVQDKKWKIFCAQGGLEDGKLSVASDETGVTRFDQAVSQVTWHRSRIA
jgi:hypothetical protein